MDETLCFDSFLRSDHDKPLLCLSICERSPPRSRGGLHHRCALRSVLHRFYHLPCRVSTRGIRFREPRQPTGK